MAPNCPVPLLWVGSRSTATRVTRGAISLSSSSHFPLMPYSNRRKPVVLPPGRAKLSTKSPLTGSMRLANTIGVVCPICCTAANAMVPLASITSGNPGGSLEATRRSFNKDFLLALGADFKKHGAAAIEKVRKQQPAAYMKICALLVPREMQVEHSGGIKAMTTEQIERSIEIIKEILAQREAAANATVIEGEAEV